MAPSPPESCCPALRGTLAFRPWVGQERALVISTLNVDLRAEWSCCPSVPRRRGWQNRAPMLLPGALPAHFLCNCVSMSRISS